MKRTSFRYWRLSQKINFVLLVPSLFIILVLAFLSYFISAQQLEEQSLEHLRSIKESRKQYVTHYFDQIKGQLLTQAENFTIKNALIDFNEAFNDLQQNSSSKKLYEAEQKNLGYYEEQFLPRLNANLDQQAKVNFFLPRQNVTTYLQYHYITTNSYVTGQKDQLARSISDSSQYAKVHAKYHPVIKNFLHEFAYYDIFLINKEGYIIYSVFKEVDFTTNLISGPYSQTNFAKAFNDASRLQKGELALFDFEPYLPSYSAPASFIATPIYVTGKYEGVLVFQMPVDKINDIMTGGKKWLTEGLGVSGECYVVGKDLKIRSQPRLLQEDTPTYLSALLKNGLDSITINKIDKMDNAILLQPVDTEAAKATKQGKDGVITTENYLGEKVLSAYGYLELYGLHWGIIAEMKTEEAFAAAAKIRNAILLVSLLLMAMVYYLSKRLSSSIAQPLTHIENQIKEVADGNLPVIATMPGKDEVSAINNALHALTVVQKEITSFSEKIGKGNFDVNFKPRSEGDTLGKALINMQQDLKANKEKEDTRKWTSEGLTQLSLILRTNNDPEVAAGKTVKFIAEYLQVQVVGLYLADEKEGNTMLQLLACYAFNKEKIIQQEIKAGFGLIGQVFLEGKSTFLKKVPDKYLSIRSGLGDSAPSYVAIIPMVYNEQKAGIIEIAAFKTQPKHVTNFLEKAGESIAASFSHVNSNAKTMRLLEESKKRTKQLREKEYEMQQHVEELEAVRETYLLRERKLKKEIVELKQQKQ